MGTIEHTHPVTAEQYEQMKQEWENHIKQSKALDKQAKNRALSWSVPRLIGLLSVYLLLNYTGVLPFWTDQVTPLTPRHVAATIFLPALVCFIILWVVGVAKQTALLDESEDHLKQADAIFDEAHREADVIYRTDNGRAISMNYLASGGDPFKKYNKYNLDGSFRSDFRRPRC